MDSRNSNTRLTIIGDNQPQSGTYQASNATSDVIHEEEHVGEEREQANTLNARKRKRPPKRSPHWKDYTPVTVKEGDPLVTVDKEKCNRCHKLIAANSKQKGMTALKMHTISCLRKHNEAAGQALLN